MTAPRRWTWPMVGLLLLVGVGAARGATLGTWLVSTGSFGSPLGDGGSFTPAVSADGRFVAFASDATNLAAGDTNANTDIFVRDRLLGTTERVSVDSADAPGNDNSFAAAVSVDGRFVAFESFATNLAAGDTNARKDIFVRDRLLGTTERASVDSAGAQGNSHSFRPAISADGRFVAFDSFATNLVVGDTNAMTDVFVRDRLLRTTERASVDSVGAQGNDDSRTPAISADGRFVAFESYATNLAPGDTNAGRDIFVRDRLLGTTERVSVDSAGAQGNSSSIAVAVSADGRFVAFQSNATNLAAGDTNGFSDVFVRDRLLGTTERASVDSEGPQGNDHSFGAAISADGRFVAFESFATNLAPGDTNARTDIFVRDRLLGTTERASVGSTGAQGNGISSNPAVSADGRFVAFESDATNLALGDTNGFPDVFLAHRLPGTDNVPPVADPGFDIQVDVPHDGDPVTQVAGFTLDGSRSFDPDGTLLFHEWLFPGEVLFSRLPVQTASASPGKYTLILQVMDVFGAKSRARMSVRILPESNRGPIADAGADQAVADGGGKATAVNLTAAASTDPEGDALTFAWREDGVQIAAGAAPTANLEPGRHVIELTATDPYGASSVDTVVVLVGVVDVTALVSVRKLTPTAGPKRGKSTARVRVTNRSGGSLPGQVSLVLDGMAAAKVNNETGVTTAATGTPGKPFLDTGTILRGITHEYQVIVRGAPKPLRGPCRVLAGIGPR